NWLLRSPAFVTSDCATLRASSRPGHHSRVLVLFRVPKLWSGVGDMTTSLYSHHFFGLMARWLASLPELSDRWLGKTGFCAWGSSVTLWSLPGPVGLFIALVPKLPMRLWDTHGATHRDALVQSNCQGRCYLRLVSSVAFGRAHFHAYMSGKTYARASTVQPRHVRSLTLAMFSTSDPDPASERFSVHLIGSFAGLDGNIGPVVVTFCLTLPHVERSNTLLADGLHTTRLDRELTRTCCGWLW
ncbi:hypothetical protein EDB84DRAFT_1633264, partial [Lactarius hengduanensis]